MRKLGLSGCDMQTTVDDWPTLECREIIDNGMLHCGDSHFVTVTYGLWIL